jgi:HAE1 family hydrophobic/amphiphilic exporter-1
VEVATRVLKEIERINQDIPQIHIIPIINTSDYIKRSIINVGTVIIYGGAFAILVLFFFLRNIGSTAIIAAAIPISIIATFTLLYFGGLTLNLMTLGGLALGIGMLVDNAIVVLENIYRLWGTGVRSKQAAVDGSEEVTAAIITSTLTTLVVFLPLIFVRGMSGVMFKQLSYVICFALACALAVALTLVPMLAARVLPGPQNHTGNTESRVNRASRFGDRFFMGMENRYKRLLHYALDHRIIVVAVAVLLLAGSIFLIPLVGVELMPKTDEGEVRIDGSMDVGTRLELANNAFKKIETIVKEEAPEAKSTVTFIGGSGWRGGGSHSGHMRIALVPKAERTRSSEDIADALRGKLSHIPGIKIRTRTSAGLRILRRGTADLERVHLEIRGHDLDIADALAKRVEEIVEQVDGVTDTRVTRESGNPEELIIVDRQKAADMKLTVSKIAYMLQTVLSGTSASSFREAGNEYKIRVQLKDAKRMALQEILDLTLTNAEGNPVVLRNVVQLRPRTGPVLIERKDQERNITILANIAGRDMGSIMTDIRKGLASLPVPRDFSIVFGGDYEEQQKAFRELLLTFVLALILVYMVMASLYESLRDPFVVMFSVPFAAIGVILMLLFTNTTFNVQSFIGCIMLGGIVVNNAILLVDHTGLLRRRDGMPLREAIEEAGRRRLRPILMTATTTILALVPLAIGMGEGGEVQASMARAVIGGLLSSNLITLVLVPTVYSLLASRSTKNKEITDKRQGPLAEEKPNSPEWS